MFRGNEVSRPSSTSGHSLRHKSEPNSDQEQCDAAVLKRNHSQAFKHDKPAQTSFKCSQETMICKRQKFHNRAQAKQVLMKSN